MTRTIEVTGVYTVGADDALKILHEPAFKFMAGDTPPELIVKGSVMAKGSLEDMYGIVTDPDAAGAAGAAVSLREGSEFKVLSTERGATGFLLTMDQVNFSNAGSVKVNGATFAIGLQMEGAGQVVNNAGSFVVSSHVAAGGMTLGGSSELINSGDIVVKAATEGGYGVIMYAQSHFQNSGLLKVDNELSAIAVQMSPAGTVDNDGRILAISHSGGAVGMTMWDAGAFHNAGDLIVRSVEPAVGVNLGGAAEIVNQGVISATSSGDFGRSIGIWTTDGDVQITNSGLIEADDAILAQDNLTGVNLDNSGRILGDVTLGGGADLLTNAGGLIRGDVALGAGDDSYLGGAGKLFGEISGGDGDDLIVLGKTDDRVTGGAGADSLAGGLGSDIFVYSEVSESHGALADLIADLDAGGDLDTIDLSAIDANSGRDGNQGFHLVAGLSGKAGELAVTFDAKHDVTLVLGDVDGDGQADLRIVLAGDHSDFAGFAL